MISLATSRRAFLGWSLGGFFAFSQRHALGRALTTEAARGKAGRCLVLWMNGGPSQFETFDPKPGAANGGETRAIATAVPGLSIAEALPEVARRMDRLSVVRNLTSIEGEHLRAQYLMHTGYPLISTFPRPTLGSIVAREQPSEPFPTCVSLGGLGFGPAYLGPEHAPFTIENVDQARQLLEDVRRKRGALQFLRDLGEPFGRERADERVSRRQSLLTRIEQMVETPFVAALDLSHETAATRQRYGDHNFGRSCLAARRLLEAGARFVEVQLDGWDTHRNNFAATARLCGTLDAPWSSLMDDLAANGLLEETVILWMGEFGRTPAINGDAGRDHFPAVTPAVIGGGPVPGGRTIGATDAGGASIAGPPHSIADLFATLLAHLGIDPAHEFRTDFGSPAPATDNGTPIAELA